MLKILALLVWIWFILGYCLMTQGTILPIFKSFGVCLSILIVLPFIMSISLELMYFGAWLGEIQVTYNPLTLRLIGPSTKDVGILGIDLCMLNILWLFLILLILLILLTLLILCILCILRILGILIILIFILIIWLYLLHLMRGQWGSSMHQSSLMTVYAFNMRRRKFRMF